jgi:hypothetical protein
MNGLLFLQKKISGGFTNFYSVNIKRWRRGLISAQVEL